MKNLFIILFVSFLTSCSIGNHYFKNRVLVDQNETTKSAEIIKKTDPLHEHTIEIIPIELDTFELVIQTKLNKIDTVLTKIETPVTPHQRRLNTSEIIQRGTKQASKGVMIDRAYNSDSYTSYSGGFDPFFDGLIIVICFVVIIGFFLWLFD